MRTLKNVLGKTIGLTLLSCITFSAFGQSSKNVDLLNNRDDHKLRLYISPANLADPSGNSFQLTAGKSFWRGGEIQLSVAQRLGWGNPFMLYNLMTYGIVTTDAKFEKGTRIGLELQQVYHSTEKIDFYLGLEGAYSDDEILIEGIGLVGVTILPIDERYTRQRTTFNGKMGFKFYVQKNFIIDLYVGVGMHTNEKFSQRETLEVAEVDKTWNLPWNIKFGYQF